MITPKKKTCKTCGELVYLWSKGECKKCSMRSSKPLKSSSLPKQQKPLKQYKPPVVSFQGKAMPVHTAIYMAALKYDIGQGHFPSELGGTATDVHHVLNRSKCGKDADHILNLMALTREQHEEYGDKKEHYFSLIQTHLAFLISRGHDISEYIKTLPPCLNLIKEIYKELYHEH